MKKDLGAIYQIKKCWKEEGRREEKESENNWQNLKEDATQQNNFYLKPTTALFFAYKNIIFILTWFNSQDI